MNDLIRQLKQLKQGDVNPREAWLKSNREVLLSQIKNTVAPAPAGRLENVWAGLSIFLPQSFVYNVMRPVAVLLIVALVGSSGWIATVDASYTALPGEWLYPAKRVAEKTQVVMAAMVGAKNTETKLHVEFAKRRAEETKKIAALPGNQKAAQLKQVMNDLKDELNTVNNKLEEAKASTAGSVSADVVKDVKQNSEQIKNVLQEVKDDLIGATSTADQDLSKQVTEAKDMAKDTTVKAVEAMVVKHLDGDKDVSKEEVKRAIDSTLQNVASDMGVAQQSVEGAKVVVDAVKSEAKDLAADTSKTQIQTTSTMELATKITDVAAQTKEASVQTQAVSVEVGKNINEAKDMLSKDNLSQAMGSLKAASEGSKEAEKISDKTLSSVQTVLPVVSVIKEEVAPMMATATDTKNIVIIVTTTPASPVATSVTGTQATKVSTSTAASMPTIKVTVTSTKPTATSTKSTTTATKK